MLAWCFCTSCGIKKNTFIAPMPNVPLFEKSGEARFNVAASPTHVEMQGALSFMKHFAITNGLFSGAENRRSKELGGQYFTSLIKNKKINTFIGGGWGETDINSTYIAGQVYDLINYSTKVKYNTLFVHPGIYYIDNDYEGTTRISMSLKYCFNTLTDYYFREWKTEFRGSNLIYENIVTARSQEFDCLTPLFTIERQKGVFNFSFQVGYNIVSNIGAKSQYIHYKTWYLSNTKTTSASFNHQGIIMNCLVGFRL